MKKNGNFKGLKSWLSDLKKIHLFALLTIIFSIISSLSEWHHLLELTSHFKLHYLLASLFFIVVYLLKKNFPLVMFMSLVALFNGLYLLPWYITNSSGISENHANTIKVIHSNVHTSNKQYEKFRQFINQESPDVFVVQEVNRLWVDQLKELDQEYPNRVIRAREDNFGIALYSRLPIIRSEIIHPGNAGLPSIKVHLAFNHREITLITTHPLPPINKAYYKDRNAQLAEVSELAATINTPMIIIGDLNVTMWSHTYIGFQETSELINVRQGFGVLPTWPSNLAFLGIPIDHALVSADFEVLSMKTGINIGSDHLPIVVKLALN